VEAIAGRLSHCAGILEIGPGPGVITSRVAETAQKVIAIELDDRMISALGESAPTVDVRKADALQADLAAILQELPEPRGLVSNLPYYITGPLLTRIAAVRDHYERTILMMQKEVAERVQAEAKTSARGSLSVFLQAQFEIDKVVQAPAGAFLPPPKVDSTVLEFTPNDLGVPDEKPFFKLIRQSFAQPRKTLANNLVAAYHVPREEVLTWIAEAGLKELARPQELTLKEWKTLNAVLALPTM